MTEDSNNAVSSSFLLDDDSRLNIKCFSSYLCRCILFSLDFFRLEFLSSVVYNLISIPYCSIPFSVDDLSKSMDRFDISDIEPPPLIRENSGFSFLLPQVE